MSERAPRSQVVSEEIRAMILGGRLKPGERLVEESLSAELGVSRVPVREALLALSAQGLVRIEPRRGATVAEITPRIVAELVEQRHDPEIIAQLTNTLERGNAAAKAGTRAELAQLNAEFHERLAEASRNSVLSEVMRGLRERTSLAFAINGRARARADWQEHAGVLAAVIAGDSELAALLANRHVHNAATAFAAATEDEDQAA